MKTGKAFQEFSVNDGRRVVSRTSQWEDLDDVLELANSLVDEGAEKYRDERASRDEEIDWLSGVLGRLEKAKTFSLLLRSMVESLRLLISIGRGPMRNTSAWLA